MYHIWPTKKGPGRTQYNITFIKMLLRLSLSRCKACEQQLNFENSWNPKSCSDAIPNTLPTPACQAKLGYLLQPNLFNSKIEKLENSSFKNGRRDMKHSMKIFLSFPFPLSWYVKGDGDKKITSQMYGRAKSRTPL